MIRSCPALTFERLPRLVRGESSEPSELERLARNAGPLRVAVVHPCDTPSLQAMVAASGAAGAGLITPVIVAPRGKLEALARRIRVDLTPFELEDVPHSHAAASRAVELVARGVVDALMKGSLHTDELMSAVLAPASHLLTGKRLSHCFLIGTPAYERPFIITDAAVNIAPDLDQKREIVQNAIDLAHSLVSRVRNSLPYLRCVLTWVAGFANRRGNDERKTEGATGPEWVRTRTTRGVDDATQDGTGAYPESAYCAGLRRGHRQQDGRYKRTCHLAYGFEVAFAIRQ
ncbi:phosphate acyltransferase [Paraburkholderia bengalensis]|uniref:phosphate acyltransferase n=1 Tax=Paraburkholderia bengalensis TaxID=2747562 RepID=UPI003AF8BA52